MQLLQLGAGGRMGNIGQLGVGGGKGGKLCELFRSGQIGKQIAADVQIGQLGTCGNGDDGRNGVVGNIQCDQFRQGA